MAKKAAAGKSAVAKEKKRLTAGAPLPLTSAPTEAEAAVWTVDELPFVREIHANPYDDLPRLVFADWLD